MMAKTGESDQAGNQGVARVIEPIGKLVERLPIGKLSAPQTVNCVMDIVGAILCIAFLLRADNEYLMAVCVLSVIALAVFCVLATDRRRRF
jgi:hypothetical protein